MPEQSTSVKATAYKLPPAVTQADIDECARWDSLIDQSLSSTQVAADKWRSGLAAFVSLITAGLFIKGPGATSDLSNGWRLALTLLGGGGLLVAIMGLWAALRAAAGTPAELDQTTVINKYGGVRQFQIACAKKASSLIGRAKVLVGLSLICFLAALVTLWWAPAPPSASPVNDVLVTTQRDVICGSLVSSGGQYLQIMRAGTSSAVVIPAFRILDLQVIGSCAGELRPPRHRAGH